MKRVVYIRRDLEVQMTKEALYVGWNECDWVKI